ncbi:D-alanine--D-alanine ligase family protein [Klebsormidium nitens]|uniref:D-alanine--D-alanine ligase family protein n=1 Tax=Klebsormidium nitens TaxID=105231 RepID=A0A1Y1HUF8_KLENI|nr:D-alanine--D-alanine ligase family protein [Klebsormidium nitens]|eukprot:GAQ81472.1 D-alanine--D-alanine ligase family protein [Klebsormidium nitens]
MESKAPQADEGSTTRPLRVAIICGGPSAERGISLNSARSVLDHLQSSDINVSPYYLDQNLQAYAISTAQMYSNTPSDFDFKLASTAQRFQTHKDFLRHLKENADIMWPVLHGQFGEDGGIQRLLEGEGLPFVGTGAEAAAKAFDKYEAAQLLRAAGFATLPAFLVTDPASDESALSAWFDEHGIDEENGRVVTKPACAGSSIGVSIAYGLRDTLMKCQHIIADGIDSRVVVELFASGGREFTAIVLDVPSPQNEETENVHSPRSAQPVTLLPTEVELILERELDGVKAAGAIFNYRRKYLPTRQVGYYTPPRFPPATVSAIREGAAKLFRVLGLRDFARVDGWLLRADGSGRNPDGNGGETDRSGRNSSGTIVFSDINLMSGMEQTSFLFQQAAEVGLAHADVLRRVLDTACARNGIGGPGMGSDNSKQGTPAPLRTVKVLFGGSTSERQVSLMSGTNVWLKLRSFSDLAVEPFLLAPAAQTSDSETSKEAGEREVWALPYASVLRHTVEEVVEGCEKALEPETLTRVDTLRSHVIAELERASSGAACSTSEPSSQTQSQTPESPGGNSAKASGSERKANNAGSLTPKKPLGSITPSKPRRLLLRDFIRESREENAVVFLAVHGGIGEDGTLQDMLEMAGVPHTGSDAAASRTCMDKYATAEAIAHLRPDGIFSAAKRVFPTAQLLETLSTDHTASLWDSLLRELDCMHVCVKPASDGCSTGVARLDHVGDLTSYLTAVRDRRPQLAPGALSTSEGGVEMAVPPPARFMFEPFIETDPILIRRQTEKSTEQSRTSGRSADSGRNGNGNGKDHEGEEAILGVSDRASPLVAKQMSGTELVWAGKSRWVEVTVGVLGPKGAMKALSPSITVKESGHVLSLEEKFQGGTGVNLTPPPAEIVSPTALRSCKERIELVAAALGLEGFARIDAFVHADSGEIIVIEANTVPGMTPSTVLFHQALAEEPPLYPKAFFRKVVELAIVARRP